MPKARSCFSTGTAGRPREAASSAIPSPVTPPSDDQEADPPRTAEVIGVTRTAPGVQRGGARAVGHVGRVGASRISRAVHRTPRGLPARSAPA
ncbi:hypothetical protein ACQP1K_21885 [Sphaerimonospora sp. CA-214678]|uniref:hypothetical protein n=1 Tax=Sphaerimonospora sp. CA-214678 TaxID=3240029 RepID=UPI003D90FF8C